MKEAKILVDPATTYGYANDNNNSPTRTLYLSRLGKYCNTHINERK